MFSLPLSSLLDRKFLSSEWEVNSKDGFGQIKPFIYHSLETHNILLLYL